ncbi:hypothetical protein SeLEV6574_g01475 [Synchytrium endobioticum]|nr:hypothetical protein SeLEV6574_g01475 [Synchytrium endobioticum]
MPNRRTAAYLLLLLMAGLLQHTEAVGGCWGCLGPSRGADRSKSPGQTSRGTRRDSHHADTIEARSDRGKEVFDAIDRDLTSLEKALKDYPEELTPAVLEQIRQAREANDYRAALNSVQSIMTQSGKHRAILRKIESSLQAAFLEDQLRATAHLNARTPQ